MEDDNDGYKIFERITLLFTGEKFQLSTDVSLNDLGYATKNFEKFLCHLPADSFNQNNVVTNLTELIVSFGLVKPFKDSEDRDYDSKDFPLEAKNAEEGFAYLFLLLKHFEKLDTSSKRKFLVQVLLLCATHNSNYLWTSEKSIALSRDFLKNLLECSKHETLNKLLCDDTFFPTIFKAVLKWMRPTLMKNTWMKNPSSCYVFFWFLSHVKHPHLVDYLGDILPPSFMFTSYYAVPQQTLGIKCFDHILDNVPPSLMEINGTEDAIFDAFKSLLHSKEMPIVEVLYPCLLKLPMMNLKTANHLQWFQFDAVLQQLLMVVDMESDAELRLLFLSQTYLFIKTTPCFKHVKKAIKILLQNLVANSIAEEKCRVMSLKIIQELIRSCWPIMENHCFHIMYGVLKVICDMESPNYTPDEALSKEVLTNCEMCLSLLKDACSRTFKQLVEEYLEEDEYVPGAELLKKISRESQS